MKYAKRPGYAALDKAVKELMVWRDETESVSAAKDIQHAIDAVKAAMRFTHHAEMNELRQALTGAEIIEGTD